MVTLIEVVAFVLLFPWMIYQTVKLGTFAFFRGRELFEEKQDGKKK